VHRGQRSDRSRCCFGLDETKFPRVSTDQKHCLDLGSARNQYGTCCCAHYSDVVLRGIKWRPRETTAVFSGYILRRKIRLKYKPNQPWRAKLPPVIIPPSPPHRKQAHRKGLGTNISALLIIRILVGMILLAAWRKMEIETNIPQTNLLNKVS